MANFIIIFPFKDDRYQGYVRVVNAKAPHQVKNFADHAGYKHGYAIYTESDFHEQEGIGHYPKGCIEEVDFRYWQDYVT